MNPEDAEIIEKLYEIIDMIKSKSHTSIVKTKEKLNDFDYLKDLLYSDEWPSSVSNFLICEETEESKLDRGEGVLDLIGFDLSNKSFLDFGCGEGHIALKASEIASKAVGYDIINVGNLPWEDDQKLLLTTDFSKISQYAPYDYIILYDVLDHVSNPLDVLLNVKKLCDRNTKISVRFHPWCGRHAIHQYKYINKAFIHVVFSNAELKKLGYNPEFVIRDLFPINNNKILFNEAGFEIIQNNTTTNKVEDFFKENSVVEKRIMAHYREIQEDFPEWQLSQVFNDYVISIR